MKNVGIHKTPWLHPCIKFFAYYFNTESQQLPIFIVRLVWLGTSHRNRCKDHLSFRLRLRLWILLLGQVWHCQESGFNRLGLAIFSHPKLSIWLAYTGLHLPMKLHVYTKGLVLPCAHICKNFLLWHMVPSWKRLSSQLDHFLLTSCLSLSSSKS